MQQPCVDGKKLYATIGLTQHKVKELLVYDKEVGDFFWKISKRSGNKIPGKPAGCLHHSGYWHIRVCGKLIRAHRLAWLYEYGHVPDVDIDHINGNKADNRIENLRLVIGFNNQENIKVARRDSRTGLPGAFPERSGRYKSSIQVDGESLYLGMYDTATEAHEMYVRAKKAYHKGFVAFAS